MGKQMKIEDAIKEVRTKPLVPLWPTAGTFLGLSRSATYAAAVRGDIDVAPIGRLHKAISASLLKKAKIEAA
jgi:hypothetical protein